jgi:FKBP-type peptidyl-prolyl cis-trans isomerase FkpA
MIAASPLPRAATLSTIALPARPAPTRRLAGAILIACAGAWAQTPAPAPAAASAPLPEALERAAAESGAVVTETGLVFRMLRAGQGPAPAAADTVRVHYRGSFPDGREFDSSYARGQPATFPLNRVIRCWTEGLQRMTVGSRAKLTCPSAIGYGERGARDVIPPNAVLQFEVELLGIEPAR